MDHGILNIPLSKRGSIGQAMNDQITDKMIERLLDAKAAVGHAEGIYSAGARRELDEAIAAIKAVSPPVSVADVDRMIKSWQDECAAIPMIYNQGNVLRDRLAALAGGAADIIAALVAALEPFAKMPMPEQHGEARERIHKARAALALARGAEPSAIGIDARVRSAVLEGMTDEELRRAWNIAVRACDHRRIQETDSEIERRGKPCGIASPSSSDCPSMKEVGGGFEGERYRCAVCGKGYFLDYEEMK